MIRNQDGELFVNDTTTAARQLARAMTDYGTDIESLAQSTPRDVIAAALDGYQRSLTPMSEIQMAARAEDMKELAKAMGMIGVRIAPHYTKEQAENWIAAMVDALDNYPARIAIQATRDAKRTPIEFPAQALEVIQGIADRHLQTYRVRIARLKRMMAIHDRPPLLAASDEAKAEAQRMSDEDLQEMPDHLRQLGIAGGFLIECENGSIRWATDDEQDAHRARKAAERLSRAREAQN